MPIDNDLSNKQWVRYTWARDTGHQDYVQKATKCDAYFRGDQWDPTVKARLQNRRIPSLTLNKIMATISTVLGEQVYNRSDVSFQPRKDANADTASVLNKVFKQISDNNQLDWKRSEMFADGIITSRGFLDVRIEFDDSMRGEVRINQLNPKNVVVDPDAESYDPDTWNEVFTTKWMTADDIAVLYSSADAELLRNREGSVFPFGYDSIYMNRDRFAERYSPLYGGGYEFSSVIRNIRVIERQHRKLDRQDHFLLPSTGDLRPVPPNFDRDRIAWFVEKLGLRVVKKLVKRIRWTTTADNIVLHDDWSPYEHLTVVPYFPHFRHGRTVGLVENLLDPQDLLNKTTSQELHVINTTANSGYKVKSGALTNMTVEELEERGAQTGFVAELNDMEGLEKLVPNPVPTGLDRVSYKAEEHIKGISGVSDSMMGFDREDVAAKAIDKKRQAGSANLGKPMDNLVRSDYILARNVLALVQEYYTDERVMTITTDVMQGTTEQFTVNEVQPDGSVLNDLTLGEYGLVITSVPHRETLEDSQFEQAMGLRKVGVHLPDEELIRASRLQNKAEILKRMADARNSPDAQARDALATRGAAAEVSKREAEAQSKAADAVLKHAKADKTVVEAQVLANTPPQGQEGPEDKSLEIAVASHEADLAEREFEHKQQMDYQDLALRRDETQGKLALQAQQQQQDAALREREAVAQAAAAAQKNTPSTKAK